MRTIFGGLRAEFLSYQKLPTAMFLQKISIMQALAAGMLMDFYCEIVCECFLPLQENLPNAWFLISNKRF